MPADAMKTCDPVTVLWRDTNMCTHETVTYVHDDGFCFYLAVGRRLLRDEGLTWIRGHHGPESEVRRAMVAAAAFADEGSATATRSFPHYGTAVTGGTIYASSKRKHDIEI